jgi:UDP-3-O-[3-hydroxymyristoyl] glucosamine N-acyltransferase
VHSGVRIENEVRIDEGAVVYPNTILGEGAVVQAGAVVGGDGFQAVVVGNRRTPIPHAGGVVIGAGTVIGSQTCVDRGLHSTFTTVGEETMLDNQVHVARDVRIGARCTLGAGSRLSCCAELDDDVWYGPAGVCDQFVRFGRGALIGAGSVVVDDVDPFTLVRGNPARPAGQVCLCRTTMTIGDEWVVRCTSCGREYAAPHGILAPL